MQENSYFRNMSKWWTRIAILCSGISFISCSATKPVATQNNPKIPQYAIDKQFATALFLGESALLREDYITAQKNFNGCLNLQPDNPEALFRLAQTEYKLKNIEQAIDLAAKAVKLDKDNILWYRLFYAELLQFKGEATKYAEQMQIALDLHPSDKFVYVKTDSAWRATSNFSKSEALWAKYKTIFPNNNSFADEHLFELYTLQNKTTEAMNIGKALFNSDPVNGKYVLMYGQTLNNLHKKQELQTLLTPYSKSDLLSSNKTNFYQSAYFLSFESNLPQLAADFAGKALLSSNDKSLVTHFTQAIQNNFFEGVALSQTLQTAVLNSPMNAELQLLTGIQLLKENNYLSALSYLKASKSLGNTSFILYENYCKALLQAGQLQELKKISDEGLELYPFSQELQQYNAQGK